MFDGLQFDPTAPQVATAVFVIASGVFIFVLIRVLKMPQKKIDHLSHLPLEDEPQKKTKKHSKSADL